MARGGWRGIWRASTSLWQIHPLSLQSTHPGLDGYVGLPHAHIYSVMAGSERTHRAHAAPLWTSKCRLGFGNAKGGQTHTVKMDGLLIRPTMKTRLKVAAENPRNKSDFISKNGLLISFQLEDCDRHYRTETRLHSQSLVGFNRVPGVHRY